MRVVSPECAGRRPASQVSHCRGKVGLPGLACDGSRSACFQQSSGALSGEVWVAGRCCVFVESLKGRLNECS
jgi:hypothetical protein